MRSFQRQGERPSGVGRFVEAASASEVVVSWPRALFAIWVKCAASQNCEIARAENRLVVVGWLRVAQRNWAGRQLAVGKWPCWWKSRPEERRKEILLGKDRVEVSFGVGNLRRVDLRRLKRNQPRVPARALWQIWKGNRVAKLDNVRIFLEKEIPERAEKSRRSISQRCLRNCRGLLRSWCGQSIRCLLWEIKAAVSNPVWRAGWVKVNFRLVFAHVDDAEVETISN